MTMEEMFQKINALQKQLKKLQPLKREDEERLWKKFRLEWNYNSNHMEGNTLTYGHTELLLIFDKVTGDYSGREIEEMKAHDVAIKMVVELSEDKERDLTENFIRQLNEIILVRPFWKEAITQDRQPTRREITPGEYKKFPNSVRLENGEIFHYASPEETPARMNELITAYRVNATSTEGHPLLQAAVLHYSFVRIHPFDDGNGRVARLLMNYVLMKNNFPPVIIKDADKKNYITALNKADAGDIEAFVFYVGEQLRWSLEIAIKAAKGESVDEKGDFEKKISFLKQNLGDNAEEEVQVERSPEVIKEVYLKTLRPLFVSIMKRFKQLDPMFKSRRVMLLIDGKHVDEDIAEGTLTSEEFWEHGNVAGMIDFRYFLDGFRKAGINTFNVNSTLTITFFPFVYEIKLQESNHVLSKLYHQYLSEEEVSRISEAMGNVMLTKIEELVEKLKKK